jgi:hypothetical protein
VVIKTVKTHLLFYLNYVLLGVLLTQSALHVIRGFCLQFSLKGIQKPFAIVPKAISDHFNHFASWRTDVLKGTHYRVSHNFTFSSILMGAHVFPIPSCPLSPNIAKKPFSVTYFRYMSTSIFYQNFDFLKNLKKR